MMTDDTGTPANTTPPPEPVGAEPVGAEPVGAEPVGAEPVGAAPSGGPPPASVGGPPPASTDGPPPPTGVSPTPPGGSYNGPTTVCPTCGRTVPAGEFCGACGTNLIHESEGRHSTYAAEPGEHVFHLSAVTTLFPHLPHRRTAPFRLALVVAGMILLALGLGRVTGPSIAAAAIFVPILYLLYLWEVEVYEDEPLQVIGLTFVVGIVLGIPWAHFTGPIVTNTLLQYVVIGIPWDKDLLVGLVFPLAAQVLMLVGPLLLYFLRPNRWDEALDGFTFGVASALGFTLATTIVNLWPELQSGLISNAPLVNNTLSILERGLIVPFINASTTGLICGALWLRRGKVRSLAAHGWTTSLPISLLIPILVWALLGQVNILILDTGVVAALYTGTLVALLLWVRVALHHMLLAEAVEVEIGPPVPCFHCHRVVPRMAFCPNCGIATRSTPKTGVGRVARATR